MTTAVQKAPMKIARECLVLFQDARRAAVVDNVSCNPSDSTGLAYCFDRYDQFKDDGGRVLFPVLMALPPSRFDIPKRFDCDIRYNTTLTGAELLRRLEAFRDELSELPAFNLGCRKVYKNWAVRVALRAGYALSHEKDFRDVLIVAGTDAEDNPAAFDPSIFDSPVLVPSDTDRILNRAAMEVLYPNGVVDADGTDAEGYVDESDLL